MNLIFPLTLEAAYYKQGFFNARVEFDRHIDSQEVPIEIRVPDAGRVIEGKINRTAQNNGTARIMGGAELRDCFHAKFEEGETVELHIISPRIVELRKHQETKSAR